MATIKVGDTVMWRGAFGLHAPVPAVIESMQRTKQPHTKYGEDVQSAPWAKKDYLIVSLTNGHWAYGEQLSPMPEQEAA